MGKSPKNSSFRISSNEEIEFVTKERESNVPEEEQKDWNIGDLIAYSVREEGLTNRNED